jgi:phosphoribosylaminoimidazole-succinocarboxamide synthase
MTDGQPPGWESVHRGLDREDFASEDRQLVVMLPRWTVQGRVVAAFFPERAEVRARLSAFWFQRLDFVPNNFLSLTTPGQPSWPQGCPGPEGAAAWLARRVKTLPLQAAVRGYLTGAAWEEYREAGTVGGHELPRGLRLASRLPEPVFEAVEASTDDVVRPVPWEKSRQRLGDEVAPAMREAALEIYDHARAHAEQAGVILAETRLEFGLCDEELLLCGECLTPDVSLYWAMEDRAPGEWPSRWEHAAVETWRTGAGAEASAMLPEPVLGRAASAYQDLYRRLAVGRSAA